MHTPLRLTRWYRRLTGAAVLIASALAASDASAGLWLGLGVDQPIQGDSGTVATLSWLSSKDRYPWELAVGRFPEHGIRSHFDFAPVTWYASLSQRIQWRSVFVSGGIAYNTANDDVLSGHWQFATGVGVRIQRWTLSLHHLSNAGLDGNNHGESFGLVEFAF